MENLRGGREIPVIFSTIKLKKKELSERIMSILSLEFSEGRNLIVRKNKV